jgi:hypothetical protein
MLPLVVTRLFASRTVTVSCLFSPGRIELFAGETLTEATGLLTTWTSAAAVLPLTSALIVAVPASFVVTTPSGATLAMVESDVVQRTVLAAIATPATPVDDTVRRSESPRMTCTAPGEIAMGAAAGSTTTVAVSAGPPPLAVICVTPADTAAISPAEETVATAGFSERQSITCSRVSFRAL